MKGLCNRLGLLPPRRFYCGRSNFALPMSALGHVWTTPWRELSDVAAALVGSGHVSGLFVRR